MAQVSNSSLFNDFEGIPDMRDALFVLVKTEWNASVVDELENGCRTVLQKLGARLKTLVVPGAVELPFAINRHAVSAELPSAYIALGCVIRGDTPHFEYVCQSVTYGISQLNIVLPVPVVFGVLTVNSEEQALERIGGKHGHKGEEAAVTAVKMTLLNKKISDGEL